MNTPITITIKPDNPQFQAIMDIVTGAVEVQKDEFATEAQDQLAGMGVKKDA
jgi:D-ribose pyranose/furanose isomerase RbsD